MGSWPVVGMAAAGRRSSPPSSPTWASPSPSSSASCSPGRPRCWPRSVHSLADTGNQALLLFGGKRARRPSTRNIPSATAGSATSGPSWWRSCCSAGGAAFAIYEGVEKIRHPPRAGIGRRRHQHPASWPSCSSSFSFRTAMKEANHVRAEAGWWAFVRRAKSPELPVVLLEDLGALTGLVLALSAW